MYIQNRLLPVHKILCEEDDKRTRVKEMQVSFSNCQFVIESLQI